MRAIYKYDEYLHPLWLGILILVSVITTIGISCCLRKKCGSHFRHFLNRLFGQNTNKNVNNSTIHYSYNWSCIYTSTRNTSPKLYKLVQNIKNANLEKQLASKPQNINEDEIESDLPQIPLDARTSEIARKFYASMRNTSHSRNSSSLDSCDDDTSLKGHLTSSIKEDMQLFRTPHFFQSVSNTGLKEIFFSESFIKEIIF